MLPSPCRRLFGKVVGFQTQSPTGNPGQKRVFLEQSTSEFVVPVSSGVLLLSNLHVFTNTNEADEV